MAPKPLLPKLEIPQEPILTHRTSRALTISVATTEPDLRSALNLISDGLSEQRQKVSRTVIFQPVFTGLVGLSLLALDTLFSGCQWYREWGVIWIIRGGSVMIGVLIGIWFLMSRLYGEERVGWDLVCGSAGDRVVLVTRLGKEIVGTLVLHASSRPGRVSIRCALAGEDRTPVSHDAVGQKFGLIRAWTVKQQYRRKGIGSALLREAVRVCRRNIWTGPIFERKQADSRVLDRIIGEEGWIC